jgi:hypothetical protein
MRVTLVAALGLFFYTSSASAAHIPYPRMETLARNSTDVVLCDEIQYLTKNGKPSGDYVPTYYEATVKVVRSLKGDRKPGEQLVVEVDSLYTRRLMDHWATPAKNQPIPLGRVLLFLNQREGVWHPVTCGVKLFIDGEAYCYGQFVSNPGGLWLARMAPENISIPSTEANDEGFLLLDLGSALERAKAPPADRSHGFAWNGTAIRHDYQPIAKPAARSAPSAVPTAEANGWWLSAFAGALLLLFAIRVIFIRMPRPAKPRRD